MKTAASLLLAFLLATAGCARAPAAAADTVQLHGTLHFKGTVPFVYLVLIEDTGQRWQLAGVDPQAAQTLASTRVEVEARPRARSNQDVATRLPVLQVIRLQAAAR